MHMFVCIGSVLWFIPDTAFETAEKILSWCEHAETVHMLGAVAAGHVLHRVKSAQNKKDLEVKDE